MLRLTDAEIDRFISEDLPYGDLSTHALGIGPLPGIMTMRAGAEMVISNSEEAARVIERLGGQVTVALTSGAHARTGDLVLTATGTADALLAGWKIAQTLMEYASGIATAARRIVDAARSTNPSVVVACTRKTFPGTKSVAIKSILAGGATPHRLGLSETILVFPEHRAFLAGQPLATTIAGLHRNFPERKIVVEVTSLTEAEEAIAAGADIVQLEKFSPDAVRHVSDLPRPGDVYIAAAGGVTDKNAKDYATAGAHILVSSAPYSAPPLDIKVTIEPQP
jgi:molybdenum transport protein